MRLQRSGGERREPPAPTIPHTHLGNYHILPNTPETDLKTGKTNPTTEGREEGATFGERSKRQTSSQGKGVPRATGLESQRGRGPELPEFLQLVGLQAWSCKGPWARLRESPRALPLSEQAHSLWTNKST